MKKFNTELNGYNKLEVNNFVNEVTREYAAIYEKLKTKDEEINRLKEDRQNHTDLETTLNRAILTAEESSKKIKDVARDEAKNIIDEAKKNANQIINDALIKAEKIDMETDQIRRSLEIYKKRIKSTIEEQLVMVDDVDNIKLEDKES
jgi:cell division initiation protein